MTNPRAFFVDLLRCERGGMAIETVAVAPVLALMSIGTFEIGSMASRQQELQSAATEAESIIMAAAGGAAASSADIELIIEESLGLSADQVSLEQRFRCGGGALVTDATGCDPSIPVFQYVLLDLDDSYAPVWARFGMGERVTYKVTRTVQVR